jgi:phage terminase large subunit-like protein
MTDREKAELAFYWPFWARPNQLPPAGDWRTWLVLAGRGFGKTRTGAEWCRGQVECGACSRLALVAATAADARDVMVEGESGVLAISPPWDRPTYEPSKRRLTWKNGAIATLYSADEPDRLRGPQHDGAWCDELASWRYPEAWDMLMLGLRLGRDPRVIVTTTPKPVKHLKDLMAAPTTATTGGSTYENVENLAPAFKDAIISRYEGTRLGRQELHAQLLEDVPGALWTRNLLDTGRVTRVPDLTRIVVGVDPSTTTGGDEAGIVVAGVGICYCKGNDNGEVHGFVLDDRTKQGSPLAWAREAVAAYNIHQADRLVAESNQGGEMVSITIGTILGAPPVTLVHASRGKHTRAEPVSSKYEQGMVHHVGTFAALEDELCTWVPGDASPNRLDALVWALSDLMLGTSEGVFF